MKPLMTRAILAASLLPMAGFATNTTPLSQCGAVISQPGHYKLVADIDCSQTPFTPGIRILNTRDVKLKLNGYNIRGKFNNAYYGQGTGIFVYGSRDVEIEGSHQSRIFSTQYAVRIQNSEDVKVDGDGLAINKNNQGFLISGGENVKIKEIVFQRNKQRDVQVSQTRRFRAEELEHRGQTPQGILLSQTQNAKLERVKLGQQYPHFRAILLQNARDTEIRRADVERSQVGIWLSGNQTQDTEVKYTDFNNNNCDIQVLAGAEPPQLQGSQSPLVCQ